MRKALQIALPLSTDLLEGAHAARTILFLHGILGRGNNLRSLARRFIEARPGWDAVLVDLRGHGRSPKGTPGASLEAAARDVVELATRTSHPVAAIAGHSFGGKVALEAVRVSAPSAIEHVAVIDSAPGVRETLHGAGDPLAVIQTLRSLPAVFSSTNEFVDALVQTGSPRALAQSLAQSSEREGGRVRFALDLDEVESLILDYMARDLWRVVEEPPGNAEIHLVIAERSDSFSAADRDRAMKIAASNPRVTVDLLHAGHWVHVDDPDGLLRTLLHRIV